MTESRVTDAQARDALHQLLTDSHETMQPTVEAAPEAPAPVAPAEPSVAPAPEPVVEAAPAEEADSAPPAETDDLASLKARLAEREQQVTETEQRFQSRLQAMQQRNQESERTLRERYLRKSTAADRALKVLKATRSESGVPETEVDRVIQEVEGTMNPASVSYVPPANLTEANEDQAIALNGFLNEKLMNTTEAEEFGQWIKTEGGTALSYGEQALATRDLDGFLRVAHMRFQEATRSKATQRTSAVEAVKVVQRAQKSVARASTAVPAAPRKTAVASTTPNTIDYEKITQDDISALLKKSLEMYK